METTKPNLIDSSQSSTLSSTKTTSLNVILSTTTAQQTTAPSINAEGKQKSSLVWLFVLLLVLGALGVIGAIVYMTRSARRGRSFEQV